MNYSNLKGGKEIQEFLNTLAPKIEKSIMRGAVRAGAKVLLDEVKQNIPVLSGDARDSVRISTSARKGKVTASVKAGNKKVYYLKWVEYGTAAHSITANGGFLSFGGIFTKSVNVSGIQAKPFMRPAIDTKSTEAINAAGEYIGKRLTKQGLNAPSLEVDDGEQ